MKLPSLQTILLIALIIFTLVRESCNINKSNELIKDIAEYKTEAKTYKTLNGAEVAQNKALLLQNSEQIKSLLSENDTLKEIFKAYKKLKSITTINNITNIYNDSIPYENINIPCEFEPFQVKRDSVHYRFYGTIAKDYFKIDSLIIPDEQTVVFGLRKMGFLKRKEYTAEVLHSNPLVKTTNIGQYATKEQRKKVVISIGGGYGLGLTSKQLEPNIGIHIGFPLISF